MPFIVSHTLVFKLRILWPKCSPLLSTELAHVSLASFLRSFDTLSPLSHLPTPDSRFDHIHVDKVGPFPSSEGYCCLVTCIDRFTRWPEAPSVARVLVSGWISRFGIPSVITTDRGGQFESSLWTQLMTALGTTSCRTTSYHPQPIGFECFHRQLKADLKTHANAAWTESLPGIHLVCYKWEVSHLPVGQAILLLSVTYLKVVT